MDFPQMITSPVVVGIITFSGVWLIENMAEKHKVIWSEGKCMPIEAYIYLYIHPLILQNDNAGRNDQPNKTFPTVI